MYRTISGAMSSIVFIAHVTAGENRYLNRGVNFLPQSRSRVLEPSLLRHLAGCQRFARLAALHASLAVISWYALPQEETPAIQTDDYLIRQTRISIRCNLSQTSLSRTARIPNPYACSSATRLYLSKCIGWQRRDLLRDYAHRRGSAPRDGATRNTRCRCRQSGLLRPSRCLSTGSAWAGWYRSCPWR